MEMSARFAAVLVIVVPLILIIPALNMFVTGSVANRTDCSSLPLLAVFLTLTFATMRLDSYSPTPGVIFSQKGTLCDNF